MDYSNFEREYFCSVIFELFFIKINVFDLIKIISLNAKNYFVY